MPGLLGQIQSLAKSLESKTWFPAMGQQSSTKYVVLELAGEHLNRDS